MKGRFHRGCLIFVAALALLGASRAAVAEQVSETREVPCSGTRPGKATNVLSFGSASFDSTITWTSGTETLTRMTDIRRLTGGQAADQGETDFGARDKWVPMGLYCAGTETITIPCSAVPDARQTSTGNLVVRRDVSASKWANPTTFTPSIDYGPAEIVSNDCGTVPASAPPLGTPATPGPTTSAPTASDPPATCPPDPTCDAGEILIPAPHLVGTVWTTVYQSWECQQKTCAWSCPTPTFVNDHEPHCGSDEFYSSNNDEHGCRMPGFCSKRDVPHDQKIKVFATDEYNNCTAYTSGSRASCCTYWVESEMGSCPGR